MKAVIFGAELQNLSVEVSDKRLMELLQDGDEKIFGQVYKTHFKNLYAYAFSILKNEVAAEEMVQNVFLKIWEKREQLPADIPLRAYVYRSVHNESLNYLKHQKIKSRYKLHVVSTAKTHEHIISKHSHSELEKKLRIALNELPEQCRTIFQMSRFEELKYREIAVRLNISVKTVENQMGKALKFLRTKLIDFLPLIILFLNI